MYPLVAVLYWKQTPRIALLVPNNQEDKLLAWAPAPLLSQTLQDKMETGILLLPTQTTMHRWISYAVSWPTFLRIKTEETLLTNQ